MDHSPTRLLSLWPGVGLVAANMIGAGVFLSTGFMAQRLGPGLVLLAWVVGAVLAQAGARAYAAVAEIVPRSGGEYRYLSDLLHPALGYLAGWASLLVGFSAPVAADALAAGSFANTLGVSVDRRFVGVVLIVVLMVLHVIGLRFSARAQSALSLGTGCLIVAFILLGLAKGHNQWPGWHPPTQGSEGQVGPFAESLFYVAFAFSGWNAAAYAAEDFVDPKKTVPRAMVLGSALVGIFYLLVNWIFVANLTPDRARVVFTYESQRVTLGHLVARDLLGETGGAIMSAVIFFLLTSSVSAMTFAGPRTYAAMARDGFLPRVFGGKPGRPPVGSVVLQSSLAIAIVLTNRLQQVLSNVGAIITLFTGLTALSLFRVRFGRPALGRPSPFVLGAAALYALLSAWMLYFGFREPLHGLSSAAGHPEALATNLLVWLAVVALVGLAAYATTVLLRGRRPGPLQGDASD